MYPTVGAFAQYKKMVTGSCFEQKLPENYASKAEFNLQNLTQPSDNWCQHKYSYKSLINCTKAFRS